MSGSDDDARKFAMDMLSESVGMDATAFLKLTAKEQMKIVHAEGLAFACSPNIAPLDEKGKPITSAPLAKWRGGE